MSKVIDELREHFDQRPVPNSKIIIEERLRVNAMIDAIELENDKLRKLARGMYGTLAMFDVILGNHNICETPRSFIFGENKSFKDAMRELEIEAE